MRIVLYILGVALLVPTSLGAQTPEEVKKIIGRLDIAKDVKFREGLVPALHEIDADESGMKVLEDPYETMQQAFIVLAPIANATLGSILFLAIAWFVRPGDRPNVA